MHSQEGESLQKMKRSHEWTNEWAFHLFWNNPRPFFSFYSCDNNTCQVSLDYYFLIKFCVDLFTLGNGPKKNYKTKNLSVLFITLNKSSLSQPSSASHEPFLILSGKACDLGLYLPYIFSKAIYTSLQSCTLIGTEIDDSVSDSRT